MDKIRVNAFRNGSDGGGKAVAVPKNFRWAEFLTVLGQKLDMLAVRVFTKDGGELDSISELMPDDVVVVSMGEDFIPALNATTSPAPAASPAVRPPTTTTSTATTTTMVTASPASGRPAATTTTPLAVKVAPAAPVAMMRIGDLLAGTARPSAPPANEGGETDAERLAKLARIREERLRAMAAQQEELARTQEADRTCAVCKSRGTSLAPLRLCGGCLQVRYCSTDHQAEHWGMGHAYECVNMRAARFPPVTHGGASPAAVSDEEMARRLQQEEEEQHRAASSREAADAAFAASLAAQPRTPTAPNSADLRASLLAAERAQAEERAALEAALETQDANASFTCKICTDNKHIDEMFFLEGCGHVFCYVCLGMYLNGKIADGSIGQGIDATQAYVAARERGRVNRVYGVQCPEPGCPYNIDYSELRILVEESVFAKFEKFTLLRTLNAMPDLGWCPRCNNAAIASPNTPELVVCSNAACRFVFCRVCQSESHEGSTCEAYQAWRAENSASDALFHVWARGIDLRHCPHCHAMIEKNGGCPNMMCQNCDRPFRWDDAVRKDASPYASRTRADLLRDAREGVPLTGPLANGGRGAGPPLSKRKRREHMRMMINRRKANGGPYGGY